MSTRAEFCRQIADLDLTHNQRAIALLWYYRQAQEYEERTASELANDLHDEGFPKPNVTRLNGELARSPFTTRGSRRGTFQIDVRRLAELERDYGPLVDMKVIPLSDAIIPTEWITGSRPYLEKLVQEINACYDYGFYDACAVLSRRLMESLLIEIYIHQKRHQDIQQSGTFIQLSLLVSHFLNDAAIPKSRTLRSTAPRIKDLGDTAAHDRTYITRQSDIDTLRREYTIMISELLNLSGVRP